VAGGAQPLANLDCDTGAPTKLGEYALADEAYAKLVRTLSENDFRNVTPALRADILAFFGGAAPSTALAKNLQAWQDTERAIEKLRALAASSAIE
jgi:hypothetical protein